ncbi:MAG: hypothetical protein RLY31_1509 [Bacteroidota bacterium]|jgi:hypothetical protein
MTPPYLTPLRIARNPPPSLNKPAGTQQTRTGRFSLA